MQPEGSSRPRGGYRIGYLNPFSEKAENQALASLNEAARRLGHQMVGVATSEEILALAPDFVIAVATSQPKLTDVPTFGAIHEPKLRLCSDEVLFRNLLTYDGYLTISDTLADFLRSLNIGFRRREGVGFYYNTPQISDLAADIPAVVRAGALELCYFGTNWDRRARPLLRALTLRPYMRIHGPEEAWDYLAGAPSYKGSVPFDGQSVQKVYAEHGVGLVVLSREHRMDDVISNRIFEISSVGAAAVCPDIPWIKANFGDTVSYYSADRPVIESLSQIDDIMDAIAADPAAAAERARRARDIFEARFAAERVIDSAIDYFEGWRAQPAPAGPSAPVDVILRLSAGEPASIQASIASLQAQTAGHIRLIIAGHGAADLARDATIAQGRIIEVAAQDLPDNDRHAALIAGLAAVTHPLFAVIDEGDQWMGACIAQASALLAGETEPATAFCLVIDRDAGGAEGEGRTVRARPNPSMLLMDSLSGLGLEGVFAPSILIDRIDMAAVAQAGVSDAVFVMQLLKHAKALYGHRPAVLAGPKTGARAPLSPIADNITALLRLGPKAQEAKARLCPLSDYWQDLSAAVRQDIYVKEQAEIADDKANAVEAGVPVKSIHERTDLITKQITLVEERLWGQEGTHIAEGEFGPAVNIVSPEPHAYCATLNLRGLLMDEPHWVVAEFADISAPFRVGVVNAETEEFLEQDLVPALRERLEVWVRVENPVPAKFVLMASDLMFEQPLRLVGLWAARPADGGSLR